MRVLVLVIITFSLTGCLSVPNMARRVTTEICNMTPAERIVLRDNIDSLVYPSKIRVYCGTDKE